MALISWPEVVTGVVTTALAAIVTAPWWTRLSTPLTRLCKIQQYRAKLELDNSEKIDHLNERVGKVEGRVMINGEQSAISIDQNKVIIELLEAAVVQCDAEGKVVWVSQRWTQFAGIQRDEALRDGWARAIHPDDIDRVNEAWTDAVKHKRPLNIIFRFTTGLRVQSKAVPITYDGEVVAYRAQLEPVHAGTPKQPFTGLTS